ncbi:Signal transduction histidine kinase [Celeribacter baekdonensis]|uniref:histidine kinase n=1 Tax=Celeribacter baekdonensis TaxID=875171 RepID=A0A1G7U6K3_9RHOB|nr:ATP-binding protein [Celeribacter baekdonensis]SDG43262.1 Signal transduction histidine kinase [Celeribacter baekdonensis]
MAKFHIRARTIDLLGRQQIANISTAISELFKNAHDAYATTAEVDYFRDDGMFVLRDDGLGMTKQDFEDRWLTLGTDSKVGSFSGLKRPPVDSAQDVRPLLGEKGIGRLAIAVIGRQVLVLTRAKVDGQTEDTITAAYIHWGLFELPGIDLDEIVIPLETFRADTLPNLEDVQKMVAKARDSLETLSSRIDDKTAKTIREDMDAFKVDPRDASTYLGQPSFDLNGSGTHFYILPADEIIQDDIDDRDESTKATRFEKNLIGFTNTMTPDFRKPKIITRFRDHVDEGAPLERVGEKAFFSPEEFKQVDHHIRGRFDEYGQFRGKVGVYQTLPSEYVLNWSNADSRPTSCGPFDFSIAVIQPTPMDSLVDPTEHAKIRRKLERHGGIYIYKDGVRVQPYGGPDFDFLDVERRRNLRAATAYYSFRNIMGAVELTSRDNPNLVEKAGREGFREDKAYRQFRSILINFFIQSAADFFRENGGKYSEEWVEKRQELQHLDKVRKTREKQSRGKKNKFGEQLEKFFKVIDSGQLPETISGTVSDFEANVLSELNSTKTPQSKALAIGRLEAEAKLQLDQLRKEHAISKPRGVGLNTELRNNWEAYQTAMGRITSDLVLPAEKTIENIVTTTVKNNKLNLEPGLRLNAAVQKHTKETLSSMKSLRTQTEETLTDLTRIVRDTTKNSFRNVSKVVDEVLAELEAVKGMKQAEFDFSKQREAFETLVADAFEEESEKLRRIYSQLEAVLSSTQNSGSDMVEVTEALEEEVVALRERQEADFELAQIGMALNTINHEFGKTAGSLRDGLRRMKSWAHANPDMKRLYDDMRVNFDHLDSYLALFNPLDRKLQSTAVDIRGSDIFRFVSDLFEKRLKRHNVRLVADEGFKAHTLHGFHADFYPVFVNLIDNAIYWASSARKDAGIIELIEDNGDLCVRDNGRGVSSIDVRNIFELNFTRKPGGRGMGLHISRQALGRLGYELNIDPPTPNSGACFRISKMSQEKI